MSIKSLDELKKIRENQIKKVKLRETGESDEPNIEILVGMATCGIARSEERRGGAQCRSRWGPFG